MTPLVASDEKAHEALSFEIMVNFIMMSVPQWRGVCTGSCSRTHWDSCRSSECLRGLFSLHHLHRPDPKICQESAPPLFLPKLTLGKALAE